MRRSKYENTVVTALRQGWTIEQIQEECPRIIDPMTIHNIAKRHGLKARHASPFKDRRRRVATVANKSGVLFAARQFRLAVETVREYVRDHERSAK